MAEPLTTQRFPYNTDLSERFPVRRQVAGGEGFSVYEAEEDDHFCLIIDAGTMADFLDADEPALKTLVTVHSFSSDADRADYLASAGWPEIQSARVPEELAAVIDGRSSPDTDVPDVSSPSARERLQRLIYRDDG